MDTVWDSYFKNLKVSRDSSPDFRLMQYFELINNGNVLDLGIGDGRNSVPFAVNGFNIDGVDTSDTGLGHCKEIFEKYNNINLINCDIKDYHIKNNNYDLIIVANILNFFKKSDVDIIIQRIKEGLKADGVIYLTVFSTLEPRYMLLNNSQKQIEENTFYIEERNSYIHYFTKNEINEYFSDFEIFCLFEGIEYDISHGTPHYHGGIDFMARKK